MIVASMDHLDVFGSWTRTASPGWKGSRVCEDWSTLFFSCLSLCPLRTSCSLNLLSLTIVYASGAATRLVLWWWPVSHWANDSLWYLGVFHHSHRACLNFLYVLLFSSRYLISRTATSAWSLDWWFYAEDNWWLIFWASHNWSNSCLNWGPPSDLKSTGFPCSKNQS